MSVQDPGVLFSFRDHVKNLPGIIRRIKDQVIERDIDIVELIGNGEAVDHRPLELLIGGHQLRVHDLDGCETIEEFTVDRSAVFEDLAVDVITETAQGLAVVQDGVVVHCSVGDDNKIVSLVFDVYECIHSVIFLLTCCFGRLGRGTKCPVCGCERRGLAQELAVRTGSLCLRTGSVCLCAGPVSGNRVCLCDGPGVSARILFRLGGSAFLRCRRLLGSLAAGTAAAGKRKDKCSGYKNGDGFSEHDGYLLT